MLLPPRRNPFRWSAGKLFAHTLLWGSLWVGFSIFITVANVPDAGVCSAVPFCVASLYGTLWFIRLIQAQNVATENREARERAERAWRMQHGLPDIYGHPATTRIGEQPENSLSLQPAPQAPQSPRPQASKGVNTLKLYDSPPRSSSDEWV